VGKTANGTHPKDAHVKVNERGEITEIIEGKFLDDPKPDLKAAINHLVAQAEKMWLEDKKSLDTRPQLPVEKKSVPRTEVQLGGFGGQGVISAGRIIGQAAALYDKLEACFTQSYGPEARGGAAGSQVIVATDPIHHPHLIEPSSMIIMSQGAYAKYVPTLASGGILLIDDQMVELPENHRADITTYGISATQVAEQAGSGRAANTVMLGFWSAIVGAVSRDAMRQSVAESVPTKMVEMNLKVFDFGYQKGLEMIRG
jgi:2-oxoglutarate ferredoxin oxidoreductase subunit gamma